MDFIYSNLLQFFAALFFTAMIIFTRRPQNKTDVKKGESFSLECEAYSKPDLPIQYKWFHNGKDLEKSNQTLNVTSSQVSRISKI